MIRPYTPEDKKQLVTILKLNIPRYFNESEEHDFVEYLDQHLEDYFVVEEDDKIVGAGGINYFPEEKLARISWDVIHPDYQGKGIGKQLVQYRIDHIKKQPGVVLIIVRTTQLVHQFYEKMGFKLEKTAKDFWAKGFDLYQMKIELNDQ